MEGGYILTKDLPAERTASQFAGLRTSKKAVNALRGELLLAIRGQDLIPRNDGGKPHNYRLARDTTITLRAEEEEVAPLDWRDYSLLEAIKSAHSRFDTFISTDKMEWGLSLKEGSEVFATVFSEEHHHSWLRSRAVVRWVGDLGGKERGTVFGVEIMNKAHRGQGTTDGTFMGKRYFTCADNCGMFVALDKLSLDGEGNDLAAPPPSGQRYGGRGPSQHEDQQEPSRPVTRSAAAALREVQRSGDQSQQPVKKARVAVGSKEQRSVTQFKRNDRVVVYTEKGTPVHGTVRWTGRYNHPELEAAFVVGIETDVTVLKDDFPDALPEVSSVIHPDRRHGKVFLLEAFVTLESEAAAEKKKPFQSVSTCSEVDATQFDTTQAEQEETMKQVKKEIAEAAGFPKDVVEDFDQQTEELERLRLEKEERDRNKVAQTPSTAAISHATLPPSQFDRQHSTGSLGQPSPPQPRPSQLPHSQSVDPNSRGSSQLAHSQSVDTNYGGGGSVPGPEQRRGQAGEYGALSNHDDRHRQQSDERTVPVPGYAVRQDTAGREDTYNNSHYPASQQSPPQPSASEQHHGHPQHQQGAGQPPPQQQLQPAGSSHQSHGQQMPPTNRPAQAVVPTPRDHDPTRILGIGSMVQVSDPPRYGVLRWIGELPDVKGAIAGVEMEEPMKGCTDGNWKGTQCFQCQSGRGFFCPLINVYPDGRFTPVGEAPRGVTAIPNPLANWPMSEMADQSSEDIDVERYLGEGRGIQGNQNSCYLDATVFGLFAVSDVFDQLFLLKDDADKDAKEIADILWKGIVNPLRKNGVVRMESVMKMRDKLEKIGMMKGVNQDEKDPEEFLNMLFKHVLHVEPFITIRRPFGVEQEYFVQLFLEFDEKVEIPTVGSLLRKMFLEQDISFTEAPSQLLIQVPRFGKKFKTYDKIFPELLLDVGELLPSSYKCFICGEPARMKCDICRSRFMSEEPDSPVYLCSTCDKRAHNSQETQGHARDKEWSPSYLKLLSVICIETSHYVCFTRADDERWIFLDSMANRVYDQYNIPRGVDCTHLLNDWVYTEDQSRLLSTPSREMPEFVRRFTQDIYMCVYINPDVSMY